MKQKLFHGKQWEDEGKKLREIVEQDAYSEEKKKMEEGEGYYCCKQDILNKNFQVRSISESYQKEGGREGDEFIPFSNPNRSNHHCVNPFHHILVAQKAAYLVGREPSITVRGIFDEEQRRNYESFLTEVVDEELNSTLYEWVVGASNKGVEYLHIYYDSKGTLCYCIVPAEQIIPFYDPVHKRRLKEVIRYYHIVEDDNGKEKERLVIEKWTDQDVTYYKENKHGVLTRDSERLSPSPHWFDVTMKDGKAVEKVAHGWGKVPFISLKNNDKEMTDLELIKGLMDAYDLLSSEGTNNLLDLVELYWVIEGYGGETASAIAKKLQINKAVHISDPSGKVEAKQISLPVEGRLQWMKMLRKDIFHFGMGVDTDSEELGKAPSGISLKFQYAMFHLKINGMVPAIKRAMKEFFWYVTEDHNRKKGTQFDCKKIDIGLNLNGITDDKEMTEIISMSKDMVSEKTLLGKHPFVDDVNAEMEQMLEERKRQTVKEVDDK